MKYIAFTLLTVLIFAGILHAEEPPRTITVTGEGLIYLPADEVVVTFGVESYNVLLDQARSTNDVDSDNLFKTLRELKIEEKRIQTTNVEVEIAYKNAGAGPVAITGYHARRAVTVTLASPKDLDTVVEAALHSGANRLLGFEYRAAGIKPAKDDARLAALKSARQKATSMAKELGCAIGRPRTIQEGATSQIGYKGMRFGYGWPYANYMMQQGAGQYQYQYTGGTWMPADASDAPPAGQIGVKATVSVTFDLEVK